MRENKFGAAPAGDCAYRRRADCEPSDRRHRRQIGVAAEGARAFRCRARRTIPERRSAARRGRRWTQASTSAADSVSLPGRSPHHSRHAPPWPDGSEHATHVLPRRAALSGRRRALRASVPEERCGTNLAVVDAAMNDRSKRPCTTLTMKCDGNRARGGREALEIVGPWRTAFSRRERIGGARRRSAAIMAAGVRQSMSSIQYAPARPEVGSTGNPPGARNARRFRRWRANSSCTERGNARLPIRLPLIR